ncbi:MAG TPA: lactate permease LctP family transporter, partial [Gemmatimonadales bacterium]|nr:lactate permease LctP family transporter [Gemmatimonadales bacterium]
MTWTQSYDPLHSWVLSTLVAALPILVLLGLLAGFRVKPHWCAMAGAATAIIVAVTIFGMPLPLAGMSFLFGVGFGMLKIAWIVLAAVFLYDISVYTGQFEIMKESVAGITADRRLQLLLVAFCFGAVIEGAAGFGAPVAIAGAFMIGLGFRPFYAAALNLIANTSPVAWGSIGTPVHTLAAVSGLPESDLSAMIGRILPITGLIVPFWLVRAMVGWRETLEVLPAILVVGGSFSVTQYLWSNHVDANLVDIAAGVISLVATLVFFRFWRPRRTWRFVDERAGTVGGTAGHTAREILRAWMPFAILSIVVLVWGLPSIKGLMNRVTTPIWNVPYLHDAVTRAAPVVTQPAPEAARFDFNWLSATGTGCFVAAIVAGLLLGVSPRQLAAIFWGTVRRMKLAVVAISFMLGLGFTTRYSGLDAVLGLAFTRTGWLFPFFGTYLGWLGVALTGSDTSSNALFGSLQRITA